MKKIILFTLALFLFSFAIVSAHTVTTACESITLSGAPANSTAVISPGNIQVAGNSTTKVSAGTYSVKWSDGATASGKVVSSCSTSNPSTPPATPPTTTTTSTTTTPTGTGTINPSPTNTGTNGTGTTIVPPPTIDVTITPDPSIVPAGGGTVVYTETITNPGTVALSNVTINNDTCSPMIYMFGDTNNNGQLDVTERWAYICQAYVGQNTTNTVNVSGNANSFVVRAFAAAPVVVADTFFALPDTGFPPKEERSSNITIYFFVFISALYFLGNLLPKSISQEI